MLGMRIACLRRRCGLSQKELAARLCLSASAVGMYEQDRREPSTELLIAMAKLFGVSTDFLLTGESEETDVPVLQELLGQLRGHLRPDITEWEAGAILATLLSAGEAPLVQRKIGGCNMDERFMREALELAAQAAAEGEVPVGCVIVDGDTIVGHGRNRREASKNALSHAELEAIDQACRTLGGWRLWRCTMYVTLEPCPMCAGAIINARLPRLVYGAADSKAGSCGSLTNLFALPYNSRPQVTAGILEEEAAALLRDFFRNLRANPVVKTWNKNR